MQSLFLLIIEANSPVELSEFTVYLSLHDAHIMIKS